MCDMTLSTSHSYSIGSHLYRLHIHACMHTHTHTHTPTHIHTRRHSHKPHVCTYTVIVFLCTKMPKWRLAAFVPHPRAHYIPERNQHFRMRSPLFTCRCRVFALYSLDLVGIEGFVCIDFRRAHKCLGSLWAHRVMRVVVAGLA